MGMANIEIGQMEASALTIGQRNKKLGILQAGRILRQGVVRLRVQTLSFW